MGFNTETGIVGGAEGGQAGYNLGGPWGAAAGTVAGALIGGFGFGGQAGMPQPGPLATMSDAEYAWYKQNIIPLQQKAYDTAFNPNLIKQQLDQASDLADTQASNSAAAFNREMAGSGVVLTPAQKAQADKTASLNKGIAEAASRNVTRAGIGAQQRGILGLRG